MVEGGGMRAVFAAGVLNAFGQAGFSPFDLYIGASAGACSLASHLAGQNSKNYNIFTTWSISPEFISLKKFLRGGHFMDLDWLWDKTISEYRLDLKTLFEDKSRTFIVVVTDVKTGTPLYLEPTADNLEDMLKASSALPLLYRGFPQMDAEVLTDGGVADAIPVAEAARRGAKKIMVVRTQRLDYQKKKSAGAWLSLLFFLRHRNLQKRLLNRAAAYQASLDFMADPPQGIEILQVAPDQTFQTSRTTRDKAILDADYQAGIKAGQAAIEQWTTGTTA